LDLWPLAWIAPIPWVLLIRRDKLGGQHPYRVLALAGFVFWMGVLHFMRLPHWATSFGWVAICCYLAFYLPVFVGLSRVAVHRLHVPVILAAPVVWTGLELLRGHLLTGMSLACLGHTQYRWIEMIQISDLAGAYGVSFVVMLVAASLARIVPFHRSLENAPRLQSGGEFRQMRSLFWFLLPAAALLPAVLLYGHHRIASNASIAGPRIALIQGSIDIELFDDPNPETMKRLVKQRNESIFREYLQLSRNAVRSDRHIDLLVWPESMFPGSLVTFDPNAAKPSWYKGSADDFQVSLKEWAKAGPETMRELARVLDVPLLLGSNREYFGVEREKGYTSAIYVARNGKIIGQYDKVHLVMFGEYMPLIEYAPWLQHFTPLTGSATPGKGPVAFELDRLGARASRPRSTVCIAPSICYESVLSHFIRGQVNALTAQGREPDVLVNLTNDGWFWGSSELDLHLMCGVFRAVECRKPFLVAANTGFSASIDSDGRIQRQGLRRAKDFIIAAPRLDRDRRSWYLDHGDWFAGACLAACALFAVVGLYRPLRRFPFRRSPQNP
jgi:apolipoprotein N-acyltransferase